MTDQISSTTVTATATGDLNSEIRYTAFGTIRYENGITPTDYRYTGQLQQAVIGLDYYNARWYDPQLGRFIQADTVIANANDPISYDHYAYVGNNPINRTDPTGHAMCDDSGNCYLRPGESRPMQSAALPNITVHYIPVIQTNASKSSIVTHSSSSSSSSTTSSDGDNSSSSDLGGNKTILQTFDNWWKNYWSGYSLDAYIGGFGLSGSGGLYLNSGMEELLMMHRLTRANYTYGGQGETAGIGGDYTVYGGIVFNLKKPEDYTGPFASVGFTFALADIGVTVSYFWDSRKGPFSSGTTQGYTVGYAQGANLSLWWTTTDYSLNWRTKY
jgi:RHS repeat-associated protein